MKVIDQSWSYAMANKPAVILKDIEAAGRTCYKSEDLITDESAEKFVRQVIKSGHESVIEHASISVRIITDRGVTHELVRHRLASYSQESTRYCNYGKEKFGNELTFIKPVWIEGNALDWPYTSPQRVWYNACLETESIYLSLLKLGWSPQQARTVLTNSLKTEIVMTCNLREWRHFFRLRASKAAHPQMRALALDMLKNFKSFLPAVFEDIKVEE